MTEDRRAVGDGRDRIDELVERFEDLADGFEQDRARLRLAVRAITAALVVVALAVAGGFAADAHERSKLKDEGDARKDQTCILFEHEHAKDVRQLVQTYRYLAHLTPKQRTQGINPAVIASVPQSEDDARSSAAPAYCDAPGVGEPEPGPRIPPRPPGLFPPPKDALRWTGRS